MDQLEGSRLSIDSEGHLFRGPVTPAVERLAALVVAVTAGLTVLLSPWHRFAKYTIGMRAASSSPTPISTHCTTSSKLSTFIRLSSISFTMSSFSAIPSSIQMTGNRVGCSRSVSLIASIRRRNMLNCTRFPPFKGVPVYWAGRGPIEWLTLSRGENQPHPHHPTYRLDVHEDLVTVRVRVHAIDQCRVLLGNTQHMGKCQHDGRI
uniref:Uncharacterized protein n=1 Tax=Anopheles atroparvus TaxID=41427 RepID=A0A182IT79_ANOAO